MKVVYYSWWNMDSSGEDTKRKEQKEGGWERRSSSFVRPLRTLFALPSRPAWPGRVALKRVAPEEAEATVIGKGSDMQEIRNVTQSCMTFSLLSNRMVLNKRRSTEKEVKAGSMELAAY